MRAGTLAGLVMASLVGLVCAVNLVLTIVASGSAWELIFWGFGTLLGIFGAVVFVQRWRTRG